MKREKEIKFNPADYEYMDKMSLEGWIWEFMRRSEEHQKYWSEYKVMKDKYNKNEISFEELWKFKENSEFFKINQNLRSYIYHFSENNPLEKWDNKRDSHKDSMYRCLDGISKSYPVDVINLKWSSYSSNGKLIAHENDNVPWYPGVTRDPIGKLSQYIDNEKIVMALIDISAPMRSDEIAELLKTELVRWRKVLKVHVRDAKTQKKKKGEKNKEEEKKEEEKMKEEGKINLLVKDAKIWKSYLTQKMQLPSLSI